MNTNVGISNMAFHLPTKRMGLDRLVAHRVAEDPSLERHLERALATTGQRAIRFPEPWEDTATMAAQSTMKLHRLEPKAMGDNTRYLTVGTETGLDHSKPVSAYVQGALGKAGLELPRTHSSFQVQHACAGAALSLLGVSALLAQSKSDTDNGIVIASDIARYEGSTTAEVTQGAGAVAMLVEKSPRLLELDLSTVGYCSTDVDDFFRPLGSETAKVRGGYSMRCYLHNFEVAMQDHCAQRGQSPTEVLREFDYFVLHAPFSKMPEFALRRLLQKHLDLSESAASVYLEEHGIPAIEKAVSESGNTYSAAMWLSLGALLQSEYDRLGKDIAGKRALLVSYGSGNTTAVISARIAGGAPEVLAGWSEDVILGVPAEAGMEDYLHWMQSPHPATEGVFPESASGLRDSFYFAGLREDGYREYGYQGADADGHTEVEASRDLHGSRLLRG